jgi:hypothetical protein
LHALVDVGDDSFVPLEDNGLTSTWDLANWRGEEADDVGRKSAA